MDTSKSGCYFDLHCMKKSLKTYLKVIEDGKNKGM